MRDIREVAKEIVGVLKYNWDLSEDEKVLAVWLRLKQFKDEAWEDAERELAKYQTWHVKFSKN